MICKWCGAELPTNAAKCKRCGREVPAKSNCGGFYDLVPGAKEAPATQNPVPGTPVISQVPQNNQPAEKKTASVPVWVFLSCIGVLLVLILVLFINVSDANSQARENADRLNAIIGWMEAHDPTDSSEPTDCSEPISFTTPQDTTETQVQLATLETAAETEETTIQTESEQTVQEPITTTDPTETTDPSVNENEGGQDNV